MNPQALQAPSDTVLTMMGQTSPCSLLPWGMPRDTALGKVPGLVTGLAEIGSHELHLQDEVAQRVWCLLLLQTLGRRCPLLRL